MRTSANTKHQARLWGFKFHLIKDQVRHGTIVISYIPTTEMIADGFTKVYSKVKQAELVDKLGLARGDCEQQVSGGVLKGCG